MNGVNEVSIFVVPMIEPKHPDTFPRFRDCFTDFNQIPELYNKHRKLQGITDKIILLTRTGGDNRNH